MNDTATQTDTRARRTKRRHRSPHGLGLFVTDTELYEMLGVPPDVAKPVIADMDRRHAMTRFPQKNKLWGDRRYRPAIEAWLEQNHGLKMDASRNRRAS